MKRAYRFILIVKISQMKMINPFGIGSVTLAAIFQLRLSCGILLETTRVSAPADNDDERTKFEEDTFLFSAGFSGIWALGAANEQGHKWFVRGGYNSCHRIGQLTTRFTTISVAIQKSSLRKLKENQFAVTNTQNWDVHLHNKHYCFRGPGFGFYCIYNVPSTAPVEETEFRLGCGENAKNISAVECGELTMKEAEENQCDSDASAVVRRRHKRSARRHNTHTAKGFREDKVNLKLLDRYTGDEQVTNSLADYMKIAAENMLGLRKGRSGTKKSAPVQSLLELTAEITTITCTVVTGDKFQIAMKSFIVQQNDRNHVKEPFIDYPAYLRILNALETCKAEAMPYDFVQPEGVMDPCERTDSRISSERIYRMGQNLSLPPLPGFVVADPMRFEPIVEIVWKIFLNAHSYCYRYFSSYFNDHHTFTVSAMSYFANQIQNTWFIQGGVSNVANTIVRDEPSDSNAAESVPSYSSDRIWYGSILGDTSKTFEDIDRCYRASRVTSDEHPSYQYPWFLNRPPRDTAHDWGRRRKRDVGMDSEAYRMIPP